MSRKAARNNTARSWPREQPRLIGRPRHSKAQRTLDVMNDTMHVKLFDKPEGAGYYSQTFRSPKSNSKPMVSQTNIPISSSSCDRVRVYDLCMIAGFPGIDENCTTRPKSVCRSVSPCRHFVVLTAEAPRQARRMPAYDWCSCRHSSLLDPSAKPIGYEANGGGPDSGGHDTASLPSCLGAYEWWCDCWTSYLGTLCAGGPPYMPDCASYRM